MTLLLTLSVALALPVDTAAEPAPDSLFLAGGCYWGVEAVFEHLRGVTDVVAGFAVPAADDLTARAHPEHAGYAEAVRISFHSAEITRKQLLEVFFTVAHDPTQLDRQGPDVGPQYRSAIFVEDDEGHRMARSYLERLAASGRFERPIVTEVQTLGNFRLAPPDQQDFVAKNPVSLYVIINDLPKLEHLRERFPKLYREGGSPGPASR